MSLIKNKTYLLLLDSISYLDEKKIPFGSPVKFICEDSGFWFEYQGQRAMVADNNWFAEVTDENKRKVKEYRKLCKQMETLKDKINSIKF